MSSLVIHSHTQSLLVHMQAQLPHAILLAGPEGVGLMTIARAYCTTPSAPVLTVLPEKDEKVDIEKGTITIQSVRRLYDATRTVAPQGRTIIIDYAERMALPAQNAFLKLLEEPTAGTRFVLVSHRPDTLLPTILSRVQRVDVRPVTRRQSEALLDTLKVTDATKRAQLLFIAEGLPAELCRLSADDAAFEARAALVKDARQFISGTAYQRLLLAKKYKDSRTDALCLVEDALKQLRQSLAVSGDDAVLAAIARYEALHKRLSEQGNVRLQLSSASML